MAQKVLTRQDKLKRAYNALYELNQKLKNISTLYYIGSDSVVYIKPLVKFTEIFITLRYQERLSIFNGAIITPNALFDFGKKLKKSKLEVNEINDKEGYRIEFFQSDFPELRHTINIIKYTPEEIKKEMGYKRIFDIQNPDKYEVFDSEYYPLDVDQVENICDGKYVEVLLPTGELVVLTKQLFLDVRKGDYIQLAKMAKTTIDEEKGEYKIYILISHDTDLYTSYTLFAKLAVE